MDIEKYNEELKKINLEDLPETEQQKYIRESREAQEYKDILKCTRDYFKKELGIQVKDIAFLTSPIEIDDRDDIFGISGTMYQMAWHYPHSAYVSVFIESDSIKKDILIDWINENKDIQASKSILDPLSNLDKWIKSNLVSLMMHIRDFYKIIKYDVYEDKVEYISVPIIAKVKDIDSNLFNSNVYVVGYTTYRSHGINQTVVKKDIYDKEEFWLDVSQLEFKNES